MPQDELLNEKIKQLVKEAVAEALREQRPFLEEVISDFIEEMALAEFLRDMEGISSHSRKTGFGLVEGEA